jgi:hypothetical protein
MPTNDVINTMVVFEQQRWEALLRVDLLLIDLPQRQQRLAHEAPEKEAETEHTITLSNPNPSIINSMTQLAELDERRNQNDYRI